MVEYQVPQSHRPEGRLWMASIADDLPPEDHGAAAVGDDWPPACGGVCRGWGFDPAGVLAAVAGPAAWLRAAQGDDAPAGPAAGDSAGRGGGALGSPPGASRC